MAHPLLGEASERLAFHADRGEPRFTSDQLHRVCQELVIEQSMGCTRVCFDNAMAESFPSMSQT